MVAGPLYVQATDTSTFQIVEAGSTLPYCLTAARRLCTSQCRTLSTHARRDRRCTCVVVFGK